MNYSRWSLFTVIMIFVFHLSEISAQVPVLDPGKTVNPATGEMGFSLPLGVVKGVGGNDFPINLYYKAGIRTSQEASAVGLGFSYGAGSISRKVVFIPDNCPGSSAMQYEPDDEPLCFEYGWRSFWSLISMVISIAVAIVVAIVTIGYGLPAIIGYMISTGVSIGLMAASQVMFEIPDYSAGGSHTPAYDYKNGDMKGFFKGGSKTDLPDNYFISTPYINGELVWVSDDNENGHFILKQSGGSSKKNECTVKIEYDHTNEVFTVVTQDGITMVFDKADKYGNFHFSDWHRNDDEISCIFFSELRQKGALPVQWHLTRVLFPDYVDGTGGADNDPLNSLNSNIGNWICFNYNETLNASIKREQFGVTIEGPYSRQLNTVGKYNWFYEGVTLYHLAGVTTPNETAVFDYTNDRKDGVWYETGTNNPVYQPRLTGIRVLTKDSRQIREITFSTKYELRHGTENSVVSSDNPDNASLTLKAISIIGENGEMLPPVAFEYGYNPGAYRYVTTNPNNGHSFYAERRDLWGYFNPNNSNDWNANGEQSGAIDNSSGQVYAAAWSLMRVILPTGKTILWEYEANRFNFANNVQMTDDAANPQVKYGGGIRVRSITVEDGINKPKSTSFFYTQMLTPGDFEETATNSAGHATALPYPYILKASQDKRPDAARGGLYTPAKVAYEMCVVADNYNWKTHVTPNGYTVFKYITSRDYPNTGRYGTVDYSWKRGSIFSVSKYDSKNQLVSYNEKNEAYQKNTIPVLPTTIVLADIIKEKFADEGSKIATGWKYTIKTDENMFGVKKETMLKYAPDLSLSVATPDLTKDIFNTVSIIEPWEDKYHPGTGFMEDQIGSFTRTKVFGDPGQIDYIVAVPGGSLGDGRYNIDLYIGVDLPLSRGAEWPRWHIKHWQLTTIAPQHKNIIGVGVADLDNNSKTDILIFTSGFGNIVQCIVLPDIALLTGTSASFIEWGSSYTINFRLDPMISNTMPASCVVGDINGNLSPDVVFMSGPSMRTANGLIDRKLYGILDITKNMRWATSLCSFSDNIPSLKGDKISFVDYEGSGNYNDIEVTGRGYPDTDYPIHSAIIKNIAMNMSTKVLSFDAGSPLSKPDYFLIGPTSRVEPRTDFRYLGLSRDIVTDNIQDSLVFAVLRPYYYGYHCLSLIKYYQDTVIGDLDGQPNEVWQKAPNDKFLISKTIPAYWKYSAMKTSNLLGQSCQSIVCEKGRDDLNPLSDADIRSSLATTWSPHLGSFAWVPNYSYTWNNNKGAYSDFVFPSVTNPPTDPSASNTSWQLTGVINKYDSSSAPLETKNAKGIFSTTIYRNDIHLPIASVTNASYKECGVFTCDYDLDETALNGGSFFDLENGWEKGGATLSTEKHFGDNSIKVLNNFGPTRNVVVNNKSDYVFSAWVKVISGTLKFHVEYRDAQDASALNSFPVFGNTADPIYATGSWDVPSGQASDWKLFQFKVNTKEKIVAGKNTYLRIWIGNPGGVVAYIDDIRFCPKGALVSSTYYDQKWYQPTVSIDANNNPGQKVEYDDFGRPVRWYKIDKINPLNKTLLMEKKYVLSGENISVLKPDNGDVYYKNSNMNIKWSYSKVGAKVNISVITPDGPTTIMTNVDASIGQYTWAIPAAFGTTTDIDNCRIKIQDANESFKGSLSGLFTIGSSAVISPAAGTIWQIGKTEKIEWVLAGASNVTIKFYRNATDPNPITVATVSSNGKTTYAWNLPNNINYTAQAFIKIVDQANSSNYVDSGVFTVKRKSFIIRRWMMYMFSKK